MADPIQQTAANVATVDAKAVILAGVLGSLLSGTFVDGMTKKQRFIAIVSGAIMAHYLSPYVAFLFKEEGYQETIGFLIGLFGMSVCAAIFKNLQNSDIVGFILNRLKGGGS